MTGPDFVRLTPEVQAEGIAALRAELGRMAERIASEKSPAGKAGLRQGIERLRSLVDALETPACTIVTPQGKRPEGEG